MQKQQRRGRASIGICQNRTALILSRPTEPARSADPDQGRLNPDHPGDQFNEGDPEKILRR